MNKFSVDFQRKIFSAAQTILLSFLAFFFVYPFLCSSDLSSSAFIILDFFSHSCLLNLSVSPHRVCVNFCAISVLEQHLQCTGPIIKVILFLNSSHLPVCCQAVCGGGLVNYVQITADSPPKSHCHITLLP